MTDQLDDRGPSTELGPRLRLHPTVPADVALDAVRKLTDGVVLLHRLREQALDDYLCWILPLDWPEVTQFFGLAVHRADVPHPVLGHRVGGWEPVEVTPDDVPEQGG